MSSAVIIRARLPPGLDALRRASVGDAGDGVPAHVTLLYPFIEPAGLTAATRRDLAQIARRHRPFEYRQRSQAAWPDTIYVAVTPRRPFVELQRDLQAAFPTHPIYDAAPDFVFVPHITIAEGPPVTDPAVQAHRAWRTLPRPDRARAIEVIATQPNGRWRLVWRIPLGRR